MYRTRTKPNQKPVLNWYFCRNWTQTQTQTSFFKHTKPKPDLEKHAHTHVHTHTHARAKQFDHPLLILRRPWHLGLLSFTYHQLGNISCTFHLHINLNNIDALFVVATWGKECKPMLQWRVAAGCASREQNWANPRSWQPAGHMKHSLFPPLAATVHCATRRPMPLVWHGSSGRLAKSLAADHKDASSIAAPGGCFLHVDEKQKCACVQILVQVNNSQACNIRCTSHYRSSFRPSNAPTFFWKVCFHGHITRF